MIRVVNFSINEEKDIIETHKYTGTIGGFMDSLELDWRGLVIQKVLIKKNDELINPVDWDKTSITQEDDIEIMILPKGGVIKGIGSLVGGVFNFAFGWLMPRAKGANNLQGGAKSGEKLDAANLKANTPKLGQVVPEGYGRYRRYLDYLTEPRRRFLDYDRQDIDVMLCVGAGEYEITDQKIGETLLSDLSNAESTIYPPNSVLAIEHAEIWHTVNEVGNTSSGSAGLEMTGGEVTKSEMKNIDPANGYTFYDRTITRNDGSHFNSNWGIDVEIAIETNYKYKLRDIDGVYVVEGFFGFIQNDDELGINASIIGLNDGIEYRPVFLTKSQAGDSQIVYVSRAGVKLTTDQFDIFEEEVKEITFKSIWVISEASKEIVNLKAKGSANFLELNDARGVIEYMRGGSTISPYTNTYQATPNGIKTDLIEVDFFFPNGLIWVYEGLWHFFYEVSVNVQVIDTANGSVVISEDFSYGKNSIDQGGFTRQIKLPYKMVPAVRVKRNHGENFLPEVQDKVTWFGLKSFIGYQKEYPNWTTMHLSFQTGGKVAINSENQINVMQTRKLPVLLSNGKWSEGNVPTRDIASFFKNVCNSVGYKDSDIDMNELIRLHENYWKPRGEVFDYIFDDITIKQALDTGLNAGMAEFTISNGKLKPIRDEPRSKIEQSYSAQNTTGEFKQTFKTKSLDDHDGVEVEYVNPITFDEEVVQCRLPGDKGFKVKKVQLKGVTDRTRAWRIGMRERAIDKYRNKDFEFSTELDALNSEYMSFIALIDEVPIYGSQSSLILNVKERNGKHEITLSEKIRDIEGNAVFAWRNKEGSLVGPFFVLEYKENKLTVQLDEVPEISLSMELPHAYLGPIERWAHHCLVEEISPSGMDSVSVKAVNYDERVYQYDNDYPEE